MAPIRRAETSQDVERCSAVMRELRPHLDHAAFLRQVAIQQKEGYHLAFAETDGDVAAVAGYRVVHMLYAGRILYVDDLVTAAKHRSTGLGAALLSWLEAEARRLECDSLELDSGVQRVGAHRFYLNQGMHIASYHFRRPLKAVPPRVLSFAPGTGQPSSTPDGARR